MLKILEKLHKIQSEIGRMEKDGKNSFQNYSYLSETQVTTKMKDVLESNQVVFSYSAKTASTYPFKNAKGVQNFLTNVDVSYSFYDVESGEKIRGLVSGQGTDSGDKGVYKAITGAVKYIFMKNFLIPTGDDPEQDGVATNKPQNQTGGDFM